MRRINHSVAVLVLAVLAVASGGCGYEQADVSDTAAKAHDIPEQVRTAVDIAEQIQADPEGVERILDEHGMSIEQFDALMYEIAADPELSRIYAAAIE